MNAIRQLAVKAMARMELALRGDRWGHKLKKLNLHASYYVIEQDRICYRMNTRMAAYDEPTLSAVLDRPVVIAPYAVSIFLKDHERQLVTWAAYSARHTVHRL